MSRMFAYNELENDEPVLMTEEEVLEEYWEHWSKQMLKRGGLSPRITKENCLEDFLVVFWAWEVGE